MWSHNLINAVGVAHTPVQMLDQLGLSAVKVGKELKLKKACDLQFLLTNVSAASAAARRHRSKRRRAKPVQYMRHCSARGVQDIVADHAARQAVEGSAVLGCGGANHRAARQCETARLARRYESTEPRSTQVG